jgi:thiamine pyrophosphokinase
VRADLVIGDFDSLSEKPEHPNAVELAREKDDTDTLAAVKHGLEKGFRRFHIYGGSGGRFGHTMANVQMLAYLARRGARGYLYGEGFVATCIHNETLEFDPACKGMVSVFAYSGTAEGVYLEGLKYELRGATLSSDFPLGVSNEFTGAESRASVRDGTLLVVLEEESAASCMK